MTMEEFTFWFTEFGAFVLGLMVGYGIGLAYCWYLYSRRQKRELARYVALLEAKVGYSRSAPIFPE